MGSKMDTEIIPAKRGGRPIGSRNQRTVFVESLFSNDPEKVQAMVNTAVTKAIDGDADFAKIVFDRIAPAPKGRFIRMEWPTGLGLAGIATAYDSILAAIGEGLITISEGQELAKILESQ